MPIRFFLGNEEDSYNEARMRPGAELASYEANPEPDTRLEEYEKIKKSIPVSVSIWMGSVLHFHTMSPFMKQCGRIRGRSLFGSGSES